eukprot:CAMPEP_0202454194 /NCGR_PEP_ID=MMETSP1360-20130828/11995_1 /ASSEMBLY_ACC=CAM_ASM_000848 /TAXON_ID=515479 /ORGANISM="Licmophora paradoxa, Strain CCMP2313" /LENGTH=241 /DNA_ID=CAMNT_0049073461 /DNA_START=52 /DNA_END=774 /DNA_ORIENTATION=-
MMRSLLIAALALMPSVNGFSSPRPVIQLARTVALSPSSSATSSPLFMVAASRDDIVLKEIEKKQNALLKKKQKAQESLTESETKLQALETKKKEYLNGVQVSKIAPPGNFSETAYRSAVKAFFWRLIAGAVTFITSLRFSGSLTTALTIVGSDFFSKALTMFFGERLMNKSQAGRKSGADAVGRSLMKALLWRLFAIANTLTMAVFIAKDLSMASKIAGSDAIFKTGLMFIYERVWAKIEW